MTRRLIILALAAVQLAYLGPAPTVAQTAKIAVIGRLHPGSAADPLHTLALKGFHEGMRALGHVDGQTYRLVARYAEGDERRLPTLVAELAKLDAHVILTVGSTSVRAAKAVAGEMAIVMATVAIDPVSAGFAASLARPGGNVTGLTGVYEDLNAKHFELLRELVPGLMNVAVMYKSDSLSRERIDRITATATRLGLSVRLVAIGRADDLPMAFETASAAKVGGVVVIPDPALIDRSRALIADLALHHRLPIVSAFRSYAEAGGLIAYGFDIADMNRRAAGYVDKILKGAKPGDLPIEQPTKFELVINLRAARVLGLAIPAAVVARADEVIE